MTAHQHLIQALMWRQCVDEQYMKLLIVKCFKGNYQKLSKYKLNNNLIECMNR